MALAKHFIISGRVQGVYYRASTCKKAKELGLSGWVRNLADGRVEALAYGAGPELDSFEHWLWQGPERANVTQVEVEAAAPDGLSNAETFEVR